jgi:hypothetical protein
MRELGMGSKDELMKWIHNVTMGIVRTYCGQSLFVHRVATD